MTGARGCTSKIRDSDIGFIFLTDIFRYNFFDCAMLSLQGRWMQPGSRTFPDLQNSARTPFTSMRNIKEETCLPSNTTPFVKPRLSYKQSAQLGSFWSFTYSVFRIKGMILPPSNTKITTLIFFVKITHIPKKKKKTLFSTNIWKITPLSNGKRRKKRSCSQLQKTRDLPRLLNHRNECVCLCVCVVV